MINALDEFVIDGIKTTIPLYKTIMNDAHFIKGELSTDYLDRYAIIDKMNDEIKSKFNNDSKVLPGVAAVLLFSEYAKNYSNFVNTKESNTILRNISNNWKFGGANN
jgi:acetyl-CoA/propionyl-CoA carboxylase